MSHRPELPLARTARVRYGLEDSEAWGLGAWTDLQTARALAHALNQRRDVANHPDRGVRAGHVHALGLIHAHWQRLIANYRRQHGDACFDQALTWLEAQFGAQTVSSMLETFGALFAAPSPVASKAHPEASTTTRSEEATTTTGPATDVATQPADALESLLLLWLVHENPATGTVRDLVEDDHLEAHTGYRRMVGSLASFFAEQPPFEDGASLFDALLAPVRTAPDSLQTQLETVVAAAHPVFDTADQDVRRHVQLGLDILREEERPVFVGPGGDPMPPPPPEAHDFADLASDAARFSDDHAWMGELVLVAKNALVWLDQLSRQYQQPIQRLDEIPDDALARLARWGFTGLWLIGLWQRSEASARIKQRSGQADAGASAYAIDDYVVAESLGGDAAADVLAAQARRHGLRLACDMVPNHLGLDARWMVEHPERFVRVDHCPYPNYTFDGPDLSSDPRIAVHLEDHYYDRTDAAVVFRRTEQATGDATYVYHGNDGTAMPWNDTAQLDYLSAETREAVIETILTVARRFPIIRFDAAMTLAKRHIQRLWHPPPGTAGDIPSRAEHAVSPNTLEAQMPEEFWRQVVDRVADEVPETLLLAEAFWLMEGFFVRTLGMHRVYNSAFMHMVRDEDNASFRQTIANTLAFDPGILQRFVNFTTNPDEETAAEQFGKGDKYFAACTLMITLPGLPLFGHGQVEGLGEKYGMEYQRARLEEKPDPGFVAHHERTLVPLLRRRRLFAGVEHFHLFDFEDETGVVVEDVYAVANRQGDERALVLVHNRAGDVAGRVLRSVAKRPTLSGATLSRRSLSRLESSKKEAAMGGVDEAGEPNESARTEDARTNANGAEPADADAADVTLGPAEHHTLATALDLDVADDLFYRLRDPHRQLDYLRPSADLTDGLFTRLDSYGVRVLLDFEPLRDGVDGPVRRLAAQLEHRGVADLATTLRDLETAPLLAPLRSVFSVSAFTRLRAALEADDPAARRPLDTLTRTFGAAIAVLAPRLVESGDEPSATSVALVVEESRRRLAAFTNAAPHDAGAHPPHPFAVFGWALLARIGHVNIGDIDIGDVEPQTETVDAVPQASYGLIERGRLHRPLATVLRDAGLAPAVIDQQLAAVRLMVTHQDWYLDLGDHPASEALSRLLADPLAGRFLGLNTFDAVVWFNSEAFAALCAWLEVVAQLGIEAGHGTDADHANVETALADLRRAERQSDYRLDRLQAAVSSPRRRGENEVQ